MCLGRRLVLFAASGAKVVLNSARSCPAARAQMRGGSHAAAQVREVVQEAGLKPFPDPFIEGFKYDEEGRIVYPGMQVQVRPREMFYCTGRSEASPRYRRLPICQWCYRAPSRSLASFALTPMLILR